MAQRRWTKPRRSSSQDAAPEQEEDEQRGGRLFARAPPPASRSTRAGNASRHCYGSIARRGIACDEPPLLASPVKASVGLPRGCVLGSEASWTAGLRRSVGVTQWYLTLSSSEKDNEEYRG